MFDGTTDEVTFERSGSFLSRIERIVAPAISPALARAEDVNVPEDDGAERRDRGGGGVGGRGESCDMAIATATAPEPEDSAATIQRLVAGVTVQRTAAGGLVIEARPEAASTLAALFSGMAQLLQAAAAPTTTSDGRPGAGQK